MFPRAPYKRTPTQGWKNDYCTAFDNDPFKEKPVGQYIHYKINENTKIQLYYYPVPNRLDLYIPTSNASAFVQVLGEQKSVHVNGNRSVSISDIENNIHLLKLLAQNKLLDPAIVQDIEKSIPLRPMLRPRDVPQPK
jgi:hypothetical protein